jgi:hypothetical protein
MGLLVRKQWSSGLFFFSSGMLVYTSMVSPGYFAQKGQWPFVLFFGVILAFTGAAVGAVVRGADRPNESRLNLPK